MALNVVMMGPPGAGKGTQAERFAREYGIPKISTGDMLRDAVASGSPLGRKVRSVIDRGDLVGDEVMIDLVRERLSRPDAAGGFVLDGFPRTVRQAQALDGLLRGGSPLIVVEIQVPDEELIRRVRNRRICASCGASASAFDGDPASLTTCPQCGGRLVQRSDDGEDVVKERLKVYWRETRPMIAFYHERSTFRAINGAQPPERVRAALVHAVAGAMGVAPDGLGAAASPEPGP
jgi:adenylate kinase